MLLKQLTYMKKFWWSKGEGSYKKSLIWVYLIRNENVQIDNVLRYSLFFHYIMHFVPIN